MHIAYLLNGTHKNKKMMVFFLILICFSFSVLLSTPITSSTEPMGTIYGSVYQIKSWQTIPIPFAYVQAGDYATFTNLNGEYCLQVPISTYQVIASKPGFTTQTYTANLSTQNPCEIHFQLQFKYTMDASQEARGYYLEDYFKLYDNIFSHCDFYFDASFFE